MSDRQRGGERAAVAVRHRDAGDRQGGVLGDGLRGRHGVDRGVVDGHDRNKRGRGLAVVYSVIDDDLNDAVSRNRIVASRAEADRLQRSLVVGERGDAGERQDSGDRVVAGSHDASRQRAGSRQQVASLRVRQRDGRRSESRAVGIGDQRIDVGDRNRRPAFGERGEEARSVDCRIVGVEIDDGGIVDLVDMDDRVRQVACGRSIVDDHVDDARIGRRIGAGVVERDLPQCRLISGQ